MILLILVLLKKELKFLKNTKLNFKINGNI
jgi:hypothetical protein